MSKRRIEVSWGGGDFSVLLDLRNGHLTPYSDPTDAHHVHSRFGGTCYYTSRTGRSGEGFIDANPLIRAVQTYRIDAGRVLFPSRGDLNTIGHVVVLVPIHYRDHDIPDEYPRIAWYEDGTIIFCDDSSLLDVLTGKTGEKNLHELGIAIPYVPCAEGNLEVVNVSVYVASHLRSLTRHVQAIVEAALIKSVGFKWPDGYFSYRCEFWVRLGLHPIDSRIYKVTGGICRRVYARGELDTVKKLQAVSPRNVVVLTPTVYIQEEDDVFLLVGLFNIRGREVTRTLRISTEEAIRAMAGDFQDVVRGLCRGK